MQFLSPQTTRSWWASRPDIAVTDHLLPLGHLPAIRVDANIESNPSAAGPNARKVAEWLFAASAPVLVSVFEYGIWESSEDWPRYDRWRRSHANTNRLEHAPGHLFLPRELPDCIALLELAFTAGWGLNCGDQTATRAFHINHDGHALLIARTGFDNLPNTFKPAPPRPPAPPQSA